MRSPLARFVLATLAWLPLAFAVWYFAAPILLWPAKLLVQWVTTVGFGDLVRDVEQQGAIVTFVTSLRPGDIGARAGSISVDVNALLYSYGLPMFAALTVAAREAHWPRRLLVGYAALLPFTAWGMLADFLKNVAITAGPLVASQTGFVAWQREAIAFAYQFGALILPTVAPAVAWVLLHRGFLERMRGRPRA